MKKIMAFAAALLAGAISAEAKDFDKDAAEIAKVLLQPEVAKCVSELVVDKQFEVVSIKSEPESAESTRYMIETKIPKAFKLPGGGYDSQTRLLIVTKDWKAARDADGRTVNEATYACRTLFTQ